MENIELKNNSMKESRLLELKLNNKNLYAMRHKDCVFESYTSVGLIAMAEKLYRVNLVKVDNLVLHETVIELHPHGIGFLLGYGDAAAYRHADGKQYIFHRVISLELLEKIPRWSLCRFLGEGG